MILRFTHELIRGWFQLSTRLSTALRKELSFKRPEFSTSRILIQENVSRCVDCVELVFGCTLVYRCPARAQRAAEHAHLLVLQVITKLLYLQHQGESFTKVWPVQRRRFAHVRIKN